MKKPEYGGKYSPDSMNPPNSSKTDRRISPKHLSGLVNADTKLSLIPAPVSVCIDDITWVRTEKSGSTGVISIFSCCFFELNQRHSIASHTRFRLGSTQSQLPLSPTEWSVIRLAPILFGFCFQSMFFFTELTGLTLKPRIPLRFENREFFILFPGKWPLMRS